MQILLTVKGVAKYPISLKEVKKDGGFNGILLRGGKEKQVMVNIKAKNMPIKCNKKMMKYVKVQLRIKGKK